MKHGRLQGSMTDNCRELLLPITIMDLIGNAELQCSHASHLYPYMAHGHSHDHIYILIWHVDVRHMGSHAFPDKGRSPESSIFIHVFPTFSPKFNPLELSYSFQTQLMFRHGSLVYEPIF